MTALAYTILGAAAMREKAESWLAESECCDMEHGYVHDTPQNVKSLTALLLSVAQGAVKDFQRLRRSAGKIEKTVDAVEARCMAVDGHVTPTLQEITEKELRAIWQAANSIRDNLK